MDRFFAIFGVLAIFLCVCVGAYTIAKFLMELDPVLFLAWVIFLGIYAFKKDTYPQ